MKLHTLVVLSLFATSMMACSSSGNSDSSADGGGGSGGSSAEEFDTEAQAAEVASDQGSTQSTVSDLEAVVETYLGETESLDLELDSAANSLQIQENLESACPNVVVEIGDLGDGSASVSADFGTGCTISDTGITIAGNVSAEVDVSTEGGSLTLTLADDFSINDTGIVGTVGVNTSGTGALEFAIDVSVEEKGSLEFEGSIAFSADEDSVTSTINGSGTITPEEADTMEIEGWECAGSATTFTLTDLEHDSSECYAHSGTMDLSESYTCTMTNKKDEEVEASASVTGTIEWNENTASSGEVTVTVTTVLGEISYESDPYTAELPAYGECPAE